MYCIVRNANTIKMYWKGLTCLARDTFRLFSAMQQYPEWTFFPELKLMIGIYMSEFRSKSRMPLYHCTLLPHFFYPLSYLVYLIYGHLVLRRHVDWLSAWKWGCIFSDTGYRGEEVAPFQYNVKHTIHRYWGIGSHIFIYFKTKQFFIL